MVMEDFVIRGRVIFYQSIKHDPRPRLEQFPRPPKILLQQRPALQIRQTQVPSASLRTDAYYLPSFERDRRSALIGYGERSLAQLSQDKDLKQVPHSYNLPSMIEDKRGNAFHGGRYVLRK
jgi:hypothetical protein